jgi:hypothetical protein
MWQATKHPVVKVGARDLQAQLYNCGRVSCSYVTGNAIQILPPWKKFLAPMIEKHAIYPSFRALPINVSQADGRCTRVEQRLLALG